jgi:hypothetical protein
MPTIDDDLSQIERDIRTLKIEYEQFFNGGRSRPPADTQWRVDTLIRRYNERGGDLNFGQRFRFNNLSQTYAKYQDMWRKKVVQKEAGTARRHFGAAARTIEAQRAREAAERRAAVAPAQFFVSLSDPARENEKVHALYRKLIEARSETGENTGAPSLQDFAQFVRRKTQELENRGGREVEYVVCVDGGRVKLKARVVS